MKINGESYRTIWLSPSNNNVIQIIDQRWLPHKLIIEDLTTVEQCCIAIRDMHVRGAPLIGSTAAYGMYIAVREATEKEGFEKKIQEAAIALKATRPTAVNLAYAVNRILKAVKEGKSMQEKTANALQTAHDITEESVEHCRSI
ncbi:MAG: S-methyl-5-thioribose-1-phosphate isomerase, partial [Bacteroidetes bacterium]|nr:S-methyl-5-thioribose-1-phosphate isomerase [Bacteroidota bacterium]